MHRRNTFLYSNANVYSKEYVYILIILHITSKNHLRLSLAELTLKCLTNKLLLAFLR